MKYEELKQILLQENEIEKIQRIKGYNVNDQNLPFGEIDVPKMPGYNFLKKEIFILVNIIAIQRCLTIHMSLLNLTICFLIPVHSMSMKQR